MHGLIALIRAPIAPREPTLVNSMPSSGLLGRIDSLDTTQRQFQAAMEASLAPISRLQRLPPTGRVPASCSSSGGPPPSVAFASIGAAAAALPGEGEHQGETVCVEVTKGHRRVYRRRAAAAGAQQQQQQPEARAGSCTLPPASSGGKRPRPRILADAESRQRAAAGDSGGWEIAEDRMTHRRFWGNAVQDFLLPQASCGKLLPLFCCRP